MIKHARIETYRDLLRVLQEASEEQLNQPVQIAKSNSSRKHVHVLNPCVCFGTVDDLQLKYVRSSVDNRRHGDELVIYVDSNGFGKDGSYCYEAGPGDDLSKMDVIYPKDYDESMNWNGPAQKLANQIDLSGRIGTLQSEIDHKLKEIERIT